MQSQNILGPRRTIATLADIEAIEREMPWAQRLAHDSAYALIAEVAQRKPDHPAIVFLPNGAPEETPITITYSDLVERYVELNQTEGSFTKIPHPRYINFLAEFLANENATREEGIKAWKQLKKMDVPKTYRDWAKSKPKRSNPS